MTCYLPRGGLKFLGGWVVSSHYQTQLQLSLTQVFSQDKEVADCQPDSSKFTVEEARLEKNMNLGTA